ncbi:MAG: hypothetical protein EZS28_031946, partial [Streblomastix strix]
YALSSSFGGLELVNVIFTTEIYIGAGVGTSGASIAVCTLERAGFPNAGTSGLAGIQTAYINVIYPAQN